MTAVLALSDGVDKVVRLFMQLSLAIIVLLVLAEVFARNVLDSPLFWIEEVAVTYLGTWFVFVGASHAMKIGMLISVELLRERLPPKAAALVFVAAQAAIVLFLIVIIVYGTRLTAMTLDQRSPALQLPVGLAYFGIVAGCAVMLLHSCAAVVARFGRGDRG